MGKFRSQNRRCGGLRHDGTWLIVVYRQMPLGNQVPVADLPVRP